MKAPRVAIIHDWLNTKIGGAEQVLLELARLYPEAPIYTLLFDAAVYDGIIDPDRIRTSPLQRFPRALRKRSRYLLPWAAGAIESFDLSEFDLVISSSSAFAKSVITGPATLHVSYCYSPMRYAWDYWPRYVDEQHVGPIRRAAIHHLVSRLRLWDYYSSSRVDQWIAISQTVAARIDKYYGQPSTVIYPPAAIHELLPNADRGNYYVTLCVLTPYKKVDLAIAACNALGRRLIVIGEGADRARLEQLAGPTIEFAGRVTEERKWELLAGAQGLLFPQEEDYGIAPIEAMAVGTPVLAYERGGAGETIIDGTTGLLFASQTVDGLSTAMKQFEQMEFDRPTLHKYASQYDTTHFATHFTSYITKAYEHHLSKNS